MGCLGVCKMKRFWNQDRKMPKLDYPYILRKARDDGVCCSSLVSSVTFLDMYTDSRPRSTATAGLPSLRVSVL